MMGITARLAKSWYEILVFWSVLGSPIVFILSSERVKSVLGPVTQLEHDKLAKFIMAIIPLIIIAMYLWLFKACFLLCVVFWFGVVFLWRYILVVGLLHPLFLYTAMIRRTKQKNGTLKWFHIYLHYILISWLVWVTHINCWWVVVVLALELSPYWIVPWALTEYAILYKIHFSPIFKERLRRSKARGTFKC